MGFLGALLGKRCGLCGRRGSDVIHYVREGMNLHPKCKRGLHRSDRGGR